MAIIRKQGLKAKLASYPFDLYLLLNEKFSLIDWDAHSDEYLIPVGITLNVLLFATRCYQTSNNKHKGALDASYYHGDLFDTSKGLPTSKLLNNNTGVHSSAIQVFFNWLFNGIGTLLTTLSFVSSYLLFVQSTRTYSLFIRGPDFDPNTPSAYKAEVNPEYYNNDNEEVSIVRKIVRALLNTSRRAVGGDAVNKSKNFVWQLDVWEPSRFQLMILATFSPIHILYYYSLHTVTIFSFFFLVLLSTFLYYLIFQKFLVLVKDRQLILSETLNEYDHKFIKPRLSKRHVDVSIDATRGPYSDQSVQVGAPNLKTHEFQTFKLDDQYDMANMDRLLLKSNIKNRQSIGSSFGRTNYRDFLSSPMPNRRTTLY